jgi:hypothetical protein
MNTNGNSNEKQSYLMCYVVYHKNRTGICHETIVAVVCLQINRQ